MTRTAVVHGITPVWVGALTELAKEGKIEVVGSATGPCGPALQLLRKHKPRLFVAEVDTDDGERCLELIRKVRRADSHVKVIVIGDGEGRAAVSAAMNAGADVYVFKNADPEDIAAAMRQAFAQSFYVAAAWVPAAMRASNGNGDRVSLTKREFEVLQLVSEGHTNVAMAQRLWVTEQTVKFHLSNLYRKLKVTNRTEAARWARDNGLLMAAAGEEI